MQWVLSIIFLTIEVFDALPLKDYWDYYYTLTVYCSGAWERLLRLLLHSDSIL